jgi:hypothetical protein
MEKPENHNIYLKREKYPGQTKVLCPDINDISITWRPKPLDTTLEAIIFRSTNILFQYNSRRFQLNRANIIEAANGKPITDEQQEELDVMQEKQDFKANQLRDIQNKKNGIYGQIKEATLQKLREFTLARNGNLPDT